MWLAFISGIIVSTDALFIGISFGTQKKCKLIYVITINIYLFFLCMMGYLLGILLGSVIDIDLDIFIGTSFILLGLSTIIFHFAYKNIKYRTLKKCFSVPRSGFCDEAASQNCCRKKKQDHSWCDQALFQGSGFSKEMLTTGVLMSVEAMFITVGLTLTLDIQTLIIPVTVALAHLIFSCLTFCLSKFLRHLPPSVGTIIAGVALIVYGVLAIAV